MLKIVQHNKPDDYASSINLPEIGRLVRRRWKIITGTMLTGFSVVMLVVLFQTPVYTSTTEIILDPRGKSAAGDSDVLSGLGMDAAAIGSQLRIIKSAPVMLRVVEKLKLQKESEFAFRKPGLTERVRDFVLVNLEMDLYSLPGIQLAGIGAPGPSIREVQEIAEIISSGTRVNRVGKTYVISISFTSRDPARAARIANSIAESYLFSQMEGKSEFNRKAASWLKERSGDLQGRVQQSEKAVEQYKAENNLIGSKGKAPFEAELEDLNEKLIVARLELGEKQTQYQQVQEVLRSKGKLSSVGSLAGTDEIKKLRMEGARLAQEEAELVTRFTNRHPKVISKRNERRDLEKQIEREAGRVVDHLRSAWQASAGKVSAIEKSLGELQGKTGDERSLLVKLRELERQAAADRNVYEMFLNRYRQTSQQEKMREADTRVISVAVPSRAPSAPDRRRAALLSLVGFLALGIGFAVMREMLDNSLKTPGEVERILGVPHLVSIPKLVKRDFYHDGQDVPLRRYAVMKPLSPFAEAVRTLKVGLELSNVDNPPKVVLLTSVLPDEGKTSLCTNLAQHAASVGVKTLLIDTDLRNPSLSRMLVPGRSTGLIDLLSQRVTKQEAIIKDHSGLYILPGQSVTCNSAEILKSDSMKSLLAELREEFDFIVMDSSPLLPVIDTRVLVDAVDSVVLVVEWNRTPADVVADVVRTLDPERNRLAGVVLNKVDVKRMKYYGAFGYGGYYQAGYSQGGGR